MMQQKLGGWGMSSEINLGAVCEIVMGQSPEGDYCNENGLGVPLLNGPTEFGLTHPTPVQFTTKPKKMSLKGDLLFCVRGSTTGRMNWSDREYAIGRGLAAIRGINGYPNIYVRAVIEAKIESLLLKATGSTFPNVGKEMISEILIPYIDVNVSKEITSILHPLDDRITLLRETNATLEAIAQALFKSWFVDFDPVRAKMEGRTPAGMDEATAALFPDSFEDAELGPVPRGWRVVTMADVSTVGIGKTPPRKEQHWFSEDSNDVRWVSIRDMGICGIYASATNEFLTAEAVDKFNVRRVPDNTVLMSFKMTIGRIAITDGEMTTNEAIAHFRLDSTPPLSSEFIYLHLKQFDFSRLSSTSSIADAVNSKTVRQIPILLPNSEILTVFQEKIGVIFEMLKTYEHQDQNLATLRDALLPRLISGKLQVTTNVEPC